MNFHFLFHFPFIQFRQILFFEKETGPRPLKVISVKNKLLFLHSLSLLEIILSQLWNSPQWAVVHLTKLPTHNSTQFHAIVCLGSWKSSFELQWRLFSSASREGANSVGCLLSIHLLMNKAGLDFSLTLPIFRNANFIAVKSTKLVQNLKCLNKKLLILSQIQKQFSRSCEKNVHGQGQTELMCHATHLFLCVIWKVIGKTENQNRGLSLFSL